MGTKRLIKKDGSTVHLISGRTLKRLRRQGAEWEAKRRAIWDGIPLSEWPTDLKPPEAIG